MNKPTIGIFVIQAGRQWFMIRVKRKFSSVKVRSKIFASQRDSKQFLFNCGVFIFSFIECS